MALRRGNKKVVVKSKGPEVERTVEAVENYYRPVSKPGKKK